jgi:eukaryotic-like serine/threonine-protein kinase
MGEVYRALDTRVGRTVAIKVLPADAAAQADRRQRFEREAHAIARLNHPHICALYDVGRQGDLEFLVMEFLDGETLAARLARGPLPLDEALKHAAALAQALARAHREGITHRDLKPSNVMLTEGGIKLLDFGLAKLRDRTATSAEEAAKTRSLLDDQSTGDGLSPEGTLVGTIAYMSPEQLEGRAVDARTDIYALGLIVYEMITGQRAFAKQSQAGLIAAILTEDPPSMTALQPKTPATVERIILTALAKDPNRRWQSASDLAREISWVATGSHTTTVDTRRGTTPAWRPWMLAAAVVIVAAIGTIGMWWRGDIPRPPSRGASRSLVILPCRGGGDATTRAFCDGLTDTLSARLTPLALARGLQMTSTLEVRQRGIDDAAKAQREFGATLILEGGILRSADALRVNYVMVDAATRRQVDAFSETAAIGDPFALQDRVATWAAGVLAMRLNAGERQTLAANGTRAPGALDLYLEGRGYALDYQKPGRVDAAVDRFTRAIALDPRFALAHAALGGARWRQYEASREASFIALARTACAQALALDAQLAAAHACLGTIAQGTGAFADAVQAFHRAVDRDPTSDEANLGLARAQASSGAIGAAEATYQRAVALRPQYWATHTWLGTFYREHARYAEAVREFETATRLTPDNGRAFLILGGLYGSIGRYDEAMAALATSAQLQPSRGALANWGMVLFRLRRFDEAVAKLAEARRIGPDTYQVVGNHARAVYFAGRPDEAMRLYRTAAALGESALAINPQDADARVSVADYYARLGDRDRALAHVNALPPDLDDPHVLLFGAFVFVHLGDRTAALDWLQRAVRRGLPANELTEWIDLDPLRHDGRFAALSAK